MAKKRAQASKARGTPPERVDFIRIRVTGAYKEWVQRFTEVNRSDMSDLIDDALAAYAKAEGFEPPPKR